MQDSAKYLIHADITADGVVERSDVVGAIFGQTEGLLGNELDLRDLQQSSKVGRIDVEIRSENGQSFGDVTIASGLDKVETAILAAALETIDRVGPCRADVRVRQLEDVRAAKRRAVVERAKDLLSSFEGEVMTSQELVEAVRRSVRVEDITEYEGLPAGPRVTDSDAIIVVEGRADVLQLLQYGIKNAVAVEGTNVPDAVASLTQDRTVTAFLDGDRGGDLILKELTQVGAVDYVAFAPEGQSVEDLSRDQVMTALREKVPFDAVADASSPHETVAATDGSSRPAPPGATEGPRVADAATEPESPPEPGEPTGPTAPTGADPETDDVDEPPTDALAEPAAAEPTESAEDAEADAAASAEDAADAPTGEQSATGEDTDEPGTLAGFVRAVIEAGSGTAVLLDERFERLETVEADAAFAAVEGAEPVPATVVVDGPIRQRLLDVAAQRGVEQLVGTEAGEFVKQPTSVRVRTAEQFRS
ncbi:MAG: DNA primase DnaG [Haloarculaceae archaeon]